MMDSDSAFETIGRIASELSSLPNLDDALRFIADTLRQLLHCSDTQIWVCCRNLDQLELRMMSSEADWQPKQPISFQQGMMGMVVESLRPVVVTQSQFEGEAFVRSGVRAAAGVPILWQGEFQGMLLALDDQEARTFSMRDVRLLEWFAYETAMQTAYHSSAAQTGRFKQALAEEEDRQLRLQVTIRQLLDQRDLSANLLEIGKTLQGLGWRQIYLALYSSDFRLDQLMTLGVNEELVIEQVLPDEVLNSLIEGELESCRCDGIYYLPVDPNGTTWNRGDLLFAPIRMGFGQPVGMIRVDDPVRLDRPTPALLRPFDILVGQAGYIVENARLLHETEKTAEALAEQVDEMSMIHRADRELSAHLNVDRIMTLTMDWALRRTAADAGMLALMADDKHGLVPVIRMGYLDQSVLTFTEQNPWPLERGLVGSAARSRQTRILRGSGSAGELRLMPGAKAEIAVPLHMRGEVLGVLGLASNEEDAFSEHDANFLERLVRRAAVALDNARLFRQSEQMADDMAVLYSASRAITATLDWNEVLQRIAQSMSVILECSSCMILGYRPEIYEARVLAVYKVGTIRNTQELLPVVDTVLSMQPYTRITGTINEHRLLVIQANDPTLPDAERNYMLANRIQTVMIAPLVAQNELIGLALTIEGRRSRNFTENDLFKAETLASQASVALRQSLLYREVMELERIKSEMIRMASHDLRNPLNNIMGYVELISLNLAQYGMTPDQEEYIGSLRRSAKTMQSLIDDMLTLERVESERSSEWETFDLGGLIAEVVENERSSALLKQQSLVLHRPPHGVPVYGSLMQLRQATINLVGNAIKYTPEGGKIEVQFEQIDGRLQFSVTDNGYGISEDRQYRIFQRFYRAREVGTENIPGTGLGLSLVKMVIERHAGQVWFKSTLGEGSTFGYWLPSVNSTD